MSKPIDTQIIERARDMIRDRNKWCWGAQARDVRGHPVDPLEADAVKFCAWGALQRSALDVTGSASPTQCMELVRQIGRDLTHLVVTNDCYGREAVLALFDAALAK